VTVTGRTDVLAILGDPIVQARTPALVNAALAARGVDAVLVPMHVPAGGLASVVDALTEIKNFRGAVVTMPHKAAIVELLDDMTPEARDAGACNVIRREPDGRLVGTMYDGEGFVAGLRAAGHDVAGRRVFLAGAGSAASGIALALGMRGIAALTVHNRTAAKATALVERVRAAHPGLAAAVGGPDPAGHDLVVNATSLGMKPGDPLPLRTDGLEADMLVAEAVIFPETPLLAVAAKRGCRVHPGEAMLVAQIALMVDFMLG
jgi:shikimate dehydrogenase